MKVLSAHATPPEGLLLPRLHDQGLNPKPGKTWTLFRLEAASTFLVITYARGKGCNTTVGSVNQILLP